MKNISDKRRRENQNTFPKILPLRDVKKYCKAWQATDGNIHTAHAHCMLNI
jgi:hypothetical protein